jgi:glycosyltransferase involved in cell wall biosynthesis
MRRVLLVAYYFPPVAGIGSIRAAGFARYLSEFGWEPTVLAPARTPQPLDPSIEFDPRAVVRTGSFDPVRLARRLGLSGDGAGGPTPSGDVNGRRTVAARIRAALLGFAAYPDAQIGWYPGAVLAGERALSASGFDAIFSSAFPMTSHLIARTLARRHAVPWVAEYRDPWSADRPQEFHGAHALRLEAAIARQADALVMPSPTWASHFGEVWGRHVEVIPNGWDEQLPAQPAPERTTITYVGTYYPGRQRLAPIWDAVARLRDARPQERMCVRFVGALPAGGRSELAAAGIEDLVEETGLVPHPEALRQTAASSILIASGDTRGDVLARGTIPAKLFEYLATDRPIVYLGDPTHDAARMLAEHPGCHVLDGADPAAIDRALIAALAVEAVHERDPAGLSRRSRARALAPVLAATLEPASATRSSS